MKFCDAHWQSLRQAIEARGLNHLVAANGRDAHARAVAELTGKADDSDFDPLMAAHNMILSRCTEALGLYLFTGEYCPVCEILKVYPEPAAGSKWKDNEDYFINGPADAVLDIARSMGVATPERVSHTGGQ